MPVDSSKRAEWETADTVEKLEILYGWFEELQDELRRRGEQITDLNHDLTEIRRAPVQEVRARQAVPLLSLL